jgi:uncharacterized membrane protein YfcA
VIRLVLIVLAVLLSCGRGAGTLRHGDAAPLATRLVDRTGAVYEWSSLPRRWRSLLVGFMSSLLGIGGVIQVPAFILLFNFPTYVATATSSSCS